MVEQAGRLLWCNQPRFYLWHPLSTIVPECRAAVALEYCWVWPKNPSSPQNSKGIKGTEEESVYCKMLIINAVRSLKRWRYMETIFSWGKWHGRLRL